MFADLLFFILTLPILLVSITIHEYSHGRVAEAFGDPTPRVSGRLTLNPLAHIDPLGLLMLIIVRFGWAKPIPVNSYYFKDPDKDMAIVGMAGPAANFLTAIILALLMRAFPPVFDLAPKFIIELLQYAVWINLALGVFNLIPVPPLDGSRLLKAVLPYEAGRVMDRMEQQGFLILVILLIFPLTSAFIFNTVNTIFNLLI